MRRRALIVHCLASLIALASCSVSYAQDYPTRPVRLIVPYAPGGQADVAVRVLAEQLRTELGQPFIVVNMPGSGGAAAISMTVNSPPDGYTVCYADAAQWAINGLLHAKLPYDVERDLAPIGLFGETEGIFIAVTDRLLVKTLGDFITLAKAQPGTLTYGTPGVGSIHHLMMEDFKSGTGIEIRSIPYRTSAQSIPALLGGEVSAAAVSLAPVQSFVDEGKVRLLAISTKKRSALAPDVPSIAELAIPEFNHAGAEGLLVRAGTPRTIIEKLSMALAKSVAQPAVARRFLDLGLATVPDTSPAALTKRIHEDREKYARITKIAGISVD